MKRKIITSVLVLILVVVMATASLLTACVENKDTTLIGIAKLDKTTFFKGEAVTLHVFVQPEGEYTISADPANAVTINGDTVTFTGDITEDTTVTLTATLNRNSNIKNSVAVTYKAPAQIAPVTNISISADKTTVVKGDSVNLTVTVDPEADYTISVDPSCADLVVIQGNTATFVGDITLDKFVTFTAVLNEDASVKATAGVTYKAPAKEGQVGELTSDMIAQIGNPSITVVGTVIDHYENFDNALYSGEDIMEMTVKMEDGKWMGEWYYQGSEANKITDNYRRGEGVIIDFTGSEANPILKVYVNKHNEVASKAEKTYMSELSSWQSQHLWNHLGMLDVTTFEYDAENEIYIHNLDGNNYDDLWLMTYLSYALTPMLTETLVQIAFKVEAGKIVGMTAQTEILYDRGETTEADKASEMSYTTLDITFYDVGTTIVEDPAVYDAPEYVELLESALEQIKSADNYTFSAVDHSTREPDYDAGDYELESINTVSQKRKPSNFVSANGTVGLVGYVTRDAILLADTIKYYASLDGKDYKTEYSGYKQNDDNTFDFFKYSSDDNAMKGDRKYSGTLADILPQFDFSANIFTFDGSRTVKGVKQYTFVLIDSAITKDVSTEISMHKNASSGAATASSKLSIVVDENGNLVSTSFPYSLNYGTYMGYVTTTYSKFNSTEIDKDTFDGYIPRVIGMVWEDVTCDPLTNPQNAQTVIDLAFPGKTLPTPKAFFEVFGDAVTYFFSSDTAGSDPDGNTIYKYKFTCTAKWTKDLDENSRITNYDEIWNKIDEVFATEGYVVDKANTNEKWHTLINADTQMQVVFESYTNAYIYIQICNLGEWTLKD